MKINVSRLSSENLIEIIAPLNENTGARLGSVLVKDIVTEPTQRIIIRQKAINVLYSRMYRSFNPKVLSDLASRCEWFAKVFCEQHLKIPFRLPVQRLLNL